MTVADLYRQARSQDADRALCTMFAPAQQRSELLAIVLLAQEFAGIPDLSSEPMLAMMRLQWWRDVIKNGQGGHPLIDCLGNAIGDRLRVRDLDVLLAARESELEWRRPQSMDQLERHVDATAGTLQQITARLLNVRDEVALDHARLAGTAYGLVGVTRSHQYNLAQGRNYLPQEFDRGSNDTSAMHRILQRAQQIIMELRKAPRVNRQAVVALLPATIADVQARSLAKLDDWPDQQRLPGMIVPRLLLAYWFGRP